MPECKIIQLEDLLAAVEESGRKYDKDMVIKAYEMAKEAHGDQCRVSGEPYICHPLAVAVILIELGMDQETILAAILHDVVEDTDVSLEHVQKTFGHDVAQIVNGVTKLGKIPYSTKEEQQAENVRKMLLAMAEDVRVIITKLADRLHNMRTMKAMPEQKRRDKSRETMEVYAPIAHRLGISAIKDELEDLSLRYLDDVAYEEIENRLIRSREEQEKFLKRITERITTRMEKENIKITLTHRVKTIHGIYKKVYMQGRAFEEIFDIYAVRVIVDNIADCYNVLGIVHDMFTPIPNRFKDYISTPKNNMYKSLHTTLLNKEGIPFEVQIRTWEMHQNAEYGIAAHWKYKAGVSGKDNLEERLAWVRQILEGLKDSEDVQDVLNSIKTDIAPDEVFVLTPKGKVVRLPQGATVIDFAYAIHTDVGHKMTGAKVNGSIVSIDFVVNNGMVVEIQTSKSGGPSRDWLNTVQTSSAKNKIRTWFKKEKRDENIVEGKNMLDSEMKRNAITLPEEDAQKFLLEIAQRYQFNTVEDLYAALGYGGVSILKVFPRVRDEYVRIYKTTEQDILENALKSQAPKKPRKASGGVIVEGLDECLVKFSKCCNPLPGDDIIGFITRGYGVSIHKRDCVNVISSINDKSQNGRWVSTEWAQSIAGETFKSTIDIISDDRPGLLADLSITISNMHISIHSLIAKETKDGQMNIQITLGITGTEQLKIIMSNIKKIQSVVSVSRSFQ